MHIFNDSRKYLLVFAILILAGFCIYFSYAFLAHEDALIREKAWEKQQEVGLLCGIVDKLAEMDAETGCLYGYEDILQFSVQFMESKFHSTFAQVFDEKLNPLTVTHPGVGGGKKHNPLDYPEFVEAVSKNESGSLVYWYETAEAGGRNVHMAYHWMPTRPGNGPRYLVAVGISKFSISEGIDKKVIYGFVALILVTAAFIVGSALMLTRLGHIYESRRGDKWQGGP